MNGVFVHINIKLYFQDKIFFFKKYMLILMFMFNTCVIYYFYVNHYNISSNDT